VPNYNEEFIVITTAVAYEVAGLRREGVIKMDAEFNISVATRVAEDEGLTPCFTYHARCHCP
jgi:hypothetical protein